MGYEQAYLSAIELGLKTPSEEYMRKFKNALALGESDLDDLESALLQSRRRFVLPPQVPPATYRFCNALWAKIEEIHPAVIEAMLQMLRADEAVQPLATRQTTRLCCTHRSETPMK
jgi:hypothetical protein